MFYTSVPWHTARYTGIYQFLPLVREPSGANDVLRAAAAVAAYGPAWLRDIDPEPLRDVGGQPTPAYCKAMLVQMADVLGISPGRLQRAPSAELLDFVATHLKTARRKFFGSNRRYLELGCRSESLGDGPPALTLSVPPRHVEGWEEWWLRQATSRDTPFGTLAKGVRVNTNALLVHPCVPPALKQALLYGQEFTWTCAPPRSRTTNYLSCRENAELSGADIDRILEAGFLEGPLDYVPWCVNSIGCIVKHIPRFKVRNALDLTRSGVNAAAARLLCELDDVATVMKFLRRGMLGAKFDLADAFHCWFVLTRSCDYLGLRHPTTGQFFRYRVLPFGHSQAPAFQQAWARAVQDILRTEGLQFCAPGSPAADYGNLRLAGAYLDDFLVTLLGMLGWQACFAFYSCLLTLAHYGIPVRHIKNEWPASVVEYTGFSLDLSAGVLWVAAERRERYARELELLARGGPGSVVSRVELASVVGRLQWVVSGALPEGQAHLVECYRARDSLLRPDLRLAASEAWRPDVLVRLSADAAAELEWWRQRLTLPCRRRFFYEGCEQGLLWGREALPLLPADDVLFDEDRFFETVTTDASGWAGGAWWRHRSLHYSYTATQLAGRFGGSSNLRELFMVPHSVDRWGVVFRVLWRGTVLLLFRLDNQASVGAINRRASMVREVNDLILWLQELEARYDVCVVARYLPGVLNVRADGLSRLRGAIDDQDWQLHPALFAQLHTEWGPFQVDACSDPLGRNAHLEVYWSELNSCLDHCWADLAVYCNPPFRAAEDILRHFWTSWQRSPTTTSAVFVLPVWPSERWWRLLSGGCVVAYWPAGSSVFTAPEWRRASPSNPVPAQRVDRGVTRWAAVAVLFPHASVSLAACRPAQVPLGLFRLSGNADRDSLHLRRLPPGVVRRLSAPSGHRHPGTLPVSQLPPPPSRPPDDEGPGDVASPGGQ